MGKYLLDDHRLLHAGNHFDGAAACTARFDVNIDKSAGESIYTAIGCPIGMRYRDVSHENPLQSLGPGHRCTAFGGRLVLCLIRRFDLVAFAPLYVGELRPLSFELILAYSVLFDEIVDDRLLVAFKPADQGDYQQMERLYDMGYRENRLSVALFDINIIRFVRIFAPYGLKKWYAQN